MMRIVKDLGLALVNATVLLLIVLGVVLLMVVNRADDLTEDVVEAVAPTGQRLERIARSLERIEAGIATGPEGAGAAALAGEVAALRAEIADLRAAVAGLDGMSVEAMLAALGERIAGARADAAAP